jgi:hypothetical protein
MTSAEKMTGEGLTDVLGLQVVLAELRLDLTRP